MNTFERLSLLLNPRNIYRLNPSQIDSDVVKIAIDKGLKPGGSLYTNTEYLTQYFSSCPPEAIGAFASNIDFSLFPSEAVNNIMLAIHSKDKNTFRNILKQSIVEQLDLSQFSLDDDDLQAVTSLYKDSDYLSIPQSVRSNNDSLVRQVLKSGATAFRLRDELIKDCPSMATEIDQRVFEEVYSNIDSYIDNLGTFEDRFKDILVEKGLTDYFLYNVLLKREHSVPAFDDLYADNKEYTVKHYIDNAQDLSLEDLDKIKGFDNNSIEGILYSYLSTRLNPDVVNGLLGLLNNSVVLPDLRNKLIDTLLSDDNSLRVNNQLVEQLMFYRPDKVLDFLRDDINYLGDFVNAYNKNANRFNIDYTEYCDILSANNVKFDESMNYIVSELSNDPNLLRYSLDHSLFTEEYINSFMNRCHDVTKLFQLYQYCIERGIPLKERDSIENRINTDNFDINSFAKAGSISYKVTDINSDDVLNMLRQIKDHPDITGDITINMDKVNQDWIIKANEIIPDRIKRVSSPEYKYSKEVRRVINYDNYDLSSIIPNKELRYNMTLDNKEEVLAILREIKKHPEISSNVVLRMDTIHRDWIEEAEEILPKRVRIAPINNQYSERLPEEKSYWPQDVLAKDETISGYVKNLDPVVSKNGNLKELSTYEKFVSSFILTTKMFEYKHEDKDIVAPNLSRSVYDVIDSKDQYMVCAGYANLAVEFLDRVGIPAAYLKVWSNGEPHAIIIAHIIDEKYGTDSFFISDPTGTEINNIFRNAFPRLNMTIDEAKELYNLDDSFTDEVFDKLHVPGNSKEEREKYLMDHSHTEMPKSSVVKAMLAIQRFTDLNMEMADQNDISPDGYSRDEYNEMVAKLNSGIESLSDPFDYVNFDQDLSNFYYNVPLQEIIQVKNDEERLYPKALESSCVAKICDSMSSELDIRGNVSLKSDFSKLVIRLYDEEKYAFSENIKLSDDIEILPQTDMEVAKLSINIGDYLNYGSSFAENLDTIRERVQEGVQMLKDYQKVL